MGYKLFFCLLFSRRCFLGRNRLFNRQGLVFFVQCRSTCVNQQRRHSSNQPWDQTIENNANNNKDTAKTTEYPKFLDKTVKILSNIFSFLFLSLHTQYKQITQNIPTKKYRPHTGDTFFQGRKHENFFTTLHIHQHVLFLVLDQTKNVG